MWKDYFALKANKRIYLILRGILVFWPSISKLPAALIHFKTETKKAKSSLPLSHAYTLSPSLFTTKVWKTLWFIGGNWRKAWWCSSLSLIRSQILSLKLVNSLFSTLLMNGTLDIGFFSICDIYVEVC